MALSSGSAAHFPPGYAKEYSGYISRNVAISFIVLETVFVLLRFFCQRIGTKSFGTDDWLMLPAFFFCLSLDVTALVYIKLAPVGYHTSVVLALDPKSLIIWAKFQIVTPLLYSAACAFPRLAILTLYLRVLTSRWHRVACFTLIASVIAVAVTDILISVLLCIPLNRVWDRSVPGHCLDIAGAYRWGALPNIVVDVFMLILPLPVVWKLKASRQVKLGLVITFLTGSIGLVTSILRTVAWFSVDPFADKMWSSVTFVNWSIIEPGVYLIAACLPCYRPLLNLLLRGDARKSSKGGQASMHPVVLSDAASKILVAKELDGAVHERSLSMRGE